MSDFPTPYHVDFFNVGEAMNRDYPDHNIIAANMGEIAAAADGRIFAIGQPATWDDYGEYLASI